MSTNKMLIDASHPEETRVAVVRGNRIEEFDFESQERRQLRGNIYLAKVTRVEPSLQAAFVDYGGNRHGFLAFSEIHPDYYQIPVADRQALLDQEAADARALDDEEPEDKKSSSRKKSSRPKRRSRKASPEKADDADTAEEVSAESDDETPAVAENEDTDGGEGDDTSNVMSAMVETDSISEPLPDDSDEDDGSQEASPALKEEKPAKPKRRTTRRKPAKTKKSEETGEEVAASDAETVADEPDKAKSAKSKSTKTRRGSKSITRSKPEAVAESGAGEDGDSPKNGSENDSENSDDDVQSVGREDAMEEVPVRRKNYRKYKIQEVIKRRQVLLVQIVKEERGTKGAALTTYMSLAGRYSVLMPNTARGGGISRKITNANDRKRLKAIASDLTVPDGMGVILRTAGASRTKAEIKRDFEYLMRLWEQVRNLTLSSSAPCLVYEEGSLIKRSIRDLYDKDTGEILVAGDAGYREARDFMGMLMPSHAKNVKHYREAQSIFSKFDVEAHLDRMLSPQVTLKSGGYLVINQTEALVAIDVNSGRSTREHSIEDTALKTNLEASEEVARQLRLRDLAGLIVIDYIDMEERRNNRAVEKKLKDCLKNDRARIQIGRISHFGLMEMSRQRIRTSVLESTMDVCPHCGGQGHVRSNSAIALHIFRAIEEHLSRHSRFDAMVKTTPAIAIHLLNHKRAALMELENRYGLKILVEGDSNITGQEFKIEKGEPARGEPSSTAIVYQNNDAPAETADGKQDDAENKPRGRRSRGKRGDREEATTANASGEEENSREAKADENDEGGPRKKRRRGRRGGRRNRDQTSSGDEAGSTASPEPELPEVTADVVVADEKPEPDETPKKRTRRPKKQAPVDTSADPVEAIAEASSQPQVSEEAPRGRNTRRPRKAASPAIEENSANMMEAETSPPGKSKRGGWWSGGGGFF